MAVCDQLVVHPSYRRRGHATFMLQWGQRLCSMDNVCQGVFTLKKNVSFYSSCGYEVVGEIHVPSDDEVDGFDQVAMVWKPGMGELKWSWSCFRLC